VMHLRARGIGTAVHYPLAVHQQSFYREHQDKFIFSSAPETTRAERTTADACLPVTELAAKQVLSLPVHPALSMEELATIVKEVRTLCD
jgi:dTDP-4-amino-4,6-dideoxygalactose transaminase